MKFLQFSLLAATLAFGVVSCGNDEDTTGPVIEISNPTPGQEFKYGEVMSLNLSLSDDAGVLKFQYEFRPANVDGNVYIGKKEYFFDTYYTYLEDVIRINIPERIDATTLYDNSDYVLRVTAIDNYNNLSYKDVNIRIVNPVDED